MSDLLLHPAADARPRPATDRARPARVIDLDTYRRTRRRRTVHAAPSAPGGGRSSSAHLAEAERVITLLYRIGSGVRLTSAGYLPPAVVSAVLAEIDRTHARRGPATREANSPLVRSLRAVAFELGLVEQRDGHLRVTAAGLRAVQDAPALAEQIAVVFPGGSPGASP